MAIIAWICLHDFIFVLVFSELRVKLMGSWTWFFVNSDSFTSVLCHLNLFRLKCRAYVSCWLKSAFWMAIFFLISISNRFWTWDEFRYSIFKFPLGHIFNLPGSNLKLLPVLRFFRRFDLTKKVILKIWRFFTDFTALISRLIKIQLLLQLSSRQWFEMKFFRKRQYKQRL